MDREHDVIEELRRACGALDVAWIEEEAAKLELAEKRAARKQAERRIQEILKEVKTGSSGRPLLDHITARGQAGPLEPRWQDRPLAEILPDEPAMEEADFELVEKVRAHLELEMDEEPTVGDLAMIWLADSRPENRLEHMTSLTEAERERLRLALRDFRRERGWPPQVGMPKGFPVAWLRPVLAADVVVDTMAAAKEEESLEDYARGRGMDAATVAAAGRLDRVGQEPTIDEVSLLLAHAIAPSDMDPSPWETFRGLGAITDVQIAEVLRALWPKGYRHELVPGTAGYTVHGWPTPKFWVGHRADRPTLSERPLVDAVRAILGLPRVPPGVRAEADRLKAEAEAEAEGKKNKSKKKSSSRKGVGHAK